MNVALYEAIWSSPPLHPAEHRQEKGPYLLPPVAVKTSPELLNLEAGRQNASAAEILVRHHSGVLGQGADCLPELPHSSQPYDPWANILRLTHTFAYLFVFPGEYYKVTNIIYWI